MGAETSTPEKLGLKPAGSPPVSSLSTFKKERGEKLANMGKPPAEKPAADGAEKPSLLKTAKTEPAKPEPRKEEPKAKAEPKPEPKPEPKAEPAKPEAKVEPNAQGEKKPDGAEPKKEEPQAEPEKKVSLEYKLEVPKGSTLDAAAVEEIEAFAKARGFSKEDAEAIVARESQGEQRYFEKQQKAFVSETDGWVETLRKHPVVGGDKLEEIDHRNAVFIEKRAPGLMAVLRATGLGKQPDFFLFVHELEKGSRNDRIVRGNETAPNAPPRFEDRYKRGQNGGGT